jgi:hypothetical protein
MKARNFQYLAFNIREQSGHKPSLSASGKETYLPDVKAGKKLPRDKSKPDPRSLS